MDAALHKLRVRFTVDLHPSKLSDVEKGARERLSRLLLRYNRDFDGVLLSINNQRVLTQRAQIGPYFPLVRVEVAADVVLFRPQVGMRLVGEVNKVGADYIGLLVLGFINTAIGVQRIRKDITARLQDGCWASRSNPQHVIQVGTQVHFAVAEIQRLGGFVSLNGSLMEPGTGAEGFAAQPKKAKTLKGDRSEKKQKKRDRQEQQQQGDTLTRMQEQDQGEAKKVRPAQQQPAAQKAAAAAAPVANGVAAPATQQQPAAKADGQSVKKAKKKKDKAAGAAIAEGAAAGAGAVDAAAAAGKEKKQKKRKAEDAAAAAPGLESGKKRAKKQKQ